MSRNIPVDIENYAAQIRIFETTELPDGFRIVDHFGRVTAQHSCNPLNVVSDNAMTVKTVGAAENRLDTSLIRSAFTLGANAVIGRGKTVWQQVPDSPVQHGFASGDAVLIEYPEPTAGK